MYSTIAWFMVCVVLLVVFPWYLSFAGFIILFGLIANGFICR